MEAGRELDKLVHEHVMGGFEKMRTASNQKEYESARREITSCPFYSDDIAAAWLVVQRLSEKCVFEVHSNGDPWVAAFGTVISNGDSAPHAICLAALKVKGVEF